MAEPTSQYFGAQVTDYVCTGDPSLYSDHIFNIRAWVDQRMYSIQRSYAAFCELDSALRRKYPRTTVPTLPLAGAAQFSRKSSKINGKDGHESRLSVVDWRASMSNAATDLDMQSTLKKKLKSSFRRSDMSEVIFQRKGPLNSYLDTLLDLPEILISDVFISFFDEESVDGEVIADDIADITEVDILIASEAKTTKTIRGKHSVKHPTDARCVIVWDFQTLNYDIGFSVNFNSSEVVKYQRYNSHKKAVRGCLDIPESGEIELIWDNKYSMMRSKQLLYIVKTFTVDQVELAKKLAQDAIRAKRQFAIQRQQLTNALTKASKEILAQSGSVKATYIAPTAADISETGLFGEESLEITVSKLADEKKSLQHALAEAESALVGERSAAAMYIDRIEDMDCQKEAAVKEADSLRLEIERLQFELQMAVSGMTQPSAYSERSSFSFRDFGFLDGGQSKVDAEDTQDQDREVHYTVVDFDGSRAVERAPGNGEEDGHVVGGGLSNSAERRDDADGPGSLSTARATSFLAETFLVETADGDDVAEAANFFNSPFDTNGLTVEQVGGDQFQVLRAQLRSAMDSNEVKDLAIAGLKREKKKLKSYAKKLKEDNESMRNLFTCELHEKQLLLADRAQLATHLEKVQREVAAAQAQVLSLHQSNSMVAKKPTTSNSSIFRYTQSEPPAQRSESPTDIFATRSNSDLLSDLLRQQEPPVSSDMSTLRMFGLLSTTPQKANVTVGISSQQQADSGLAEPVRFSMQLPFDGSGSGSGSEAGSVVGIGVGIVVGVSPPGVTDTIALPLQVPQDSGAENHGRDDGGALLDLSMETVATSPNEIYSVTETATELATEIATETATAAERAELAEVGEVGDVRELGELGDVNGGRSEESLQQRKIVVSMKDLLDVWEGNLGPTMVDTLVAADSNAVVGRDHSQRSLTSSENGSDGEQQVGRNSTSSGNGDGQTHSGGTGDNQSHSYGQEEGRQAFSFPSDRRDDIDETVEDPFTTIGSGLKSMWGMVASVRSKASGGAVASGANTVGSGSSTTTELKDWKPSTGKRSSFSLSIPAVLRGYDESMTSPTTGAMSTERERAVSSSPSSSTQDMIALLGAAAANAAAPESPESYGSPTSSGSRSSSSSRGSNPISAWYLHPDRDEVSSRVLTEQLQKQLSVTGAQWTTHHIAWDAYCETFTDESQTFDLSSPYREILAGSGSTGCIKLKRTEPGGTIKCGVYLQGFRGTAEYTLTVFRFSKGAPRQMSSIYTWDCDDSRGWPNFISCAEFVSDGYVTAEGTVRVLLTLCVKPASSSRLRMAMSAISNLAN